MPRDGALTLSDVRRPTLSIVCEPCARHETYSVAHLMERHGSRPRGARRSSTVGSRRAVAPPPRIRGGGSDARFRIPSGDLRGQLPYAHICSSRARKFSNCLLGDVFATATVKLTTASTFRRSDHIADGRRRVDSIGRLGGRMNIQHHVATISQPKLSDCWAAATAIAMHRHSNAGTQHVKNLRMWALANALEHDLQTVSLH